MSLLVLAAIAFGVTAILTPLAIAVANSTGIVDRPGQLKDQVAPVPYLGGVAVLFGVLVGVLTGRPTLAVPLVAATALGVADDRFDLPPLFRVVGEVVVSVAVVVTCPVHLPGVVGAPLLVIITLLLINGVNLMDGLDMLAGGSLAVAGIGFAVLLIDPGRQVAVAMAGALIGFLLFNRPPARIYLGDGGAYLLGTALAILLASAWTPGATQTVGIATFALVAVPAAEVAFAVVRRLRGRRSLAVGDRRHPYDLLVARGWSRPSASAAYIAAEGVLATGAILATRSGSVPVAIGVCVAAAIGLTVVAGTTGALQSAPEPTEPPEPSDPSEPEILP